jgi:ATP synthase protein I
VSIVQVGYLGTGGTVVRLRKISQSPRFRGEMNREPKAPEGGLDPQSEDRRASRKVGEYAGLGLQFAVSILVFLYGGQWLDRKLGTAPWCMIVGVFVGASLAFYSMYRKLMGDLERDEAAKRR